MKSSFHTPLPPCTTERSLTLSGQPVNIRSEALLEQLPADAPRQNDAPHIENYYCQHRSGELIKVTLIRIGREILRLTDRITIKPEPSTEEDDRTKYSSNSSQQEVEPEKQRKMRKSHLSKCAKALLSAFQQWIRANEPESLRFIMAVKKEYSTEAQIVNFMASHATMRHHYLNFAEQFFSKSQQAKLEKLASTWTKRCLSAREDERVREEYIQDVLKM